MSGIRIEADVSALLAAAGAVEERQRDFRPLLNRIGQIMTASTDQNFIDQGRPDAWQPLSPVTLARRRSGPNPNMSDQILRDTGRLMNSLSSPSSADAILELTPDSLRFGTNVEYASVHQFGWPERNIPARPFMLLQQEDLEDIAAELLEWIAGAFEAGAGGAP